MTRHEMDGKPVKKQTRILDPMWLVNLSKDDQEYLFNAPIIVKSEHRHIMNQYVDVLKLCFVHNLHYTIKTLSAEEVEKEKNRQLALKKKRKEEYIKSLEDGVKASWKWTEIARQERLKKMNFN